MVERKNAKLDTGRPDRESTESERAVREQVRRRQSVTPASNDGAQSSGTSPDHPNEADDYGPLTKALGVTNPAFVDGLFNQILNAVDRSGDKFDLEQILFSCAVLRGAKPRGELESMHIAQMTVVHAALMRSAADFAHAENLAQRDSAMRAMNQLARTYTAQLEALKDYRSGAEPEVTVVSVTDRGQTTVDRVSQPTTRSKAAPDRLSLKAA